ncbi:hypothetical protein BVG19_g623 [[Candida] boidinii]|nr:hypothetical protein BVG19_g623 [[Candida] boidinii]OWB51532.1 hypothetical protein B5S27_g3095 [[Candida] boidinii]
MSTGSQPLITSQFDATAQYLASVIVSLSTHTLRIQSTVSTNNFSSVYPFEKDVKVNSITWLPLGNSNNNNISQNNKTNNKKFKNLDSNLDDQVIGIALDNGYFYIYSPTKNEIIHKILNPNNIAISHLQYNPFNDYVYSVDFQGSISEWKPSDWSLRKSIKSDSVDSSIRKIEGITYERTPYILAISQSIYLIDPENPNDLSINLPGHITQINSVVPIIKNSSILTSAVGDRFINCISLIKKATTNVFVTESPVVSIAYFENEFNMELLAAVTENGVIEIFNNPFANNEDSNDVDNEVDTNSNGKSPLKRKSVLNRRRRSAAVVKSKPSDLIISINRPKDSNPTNEKLTIQNVTITSKYLKFSWLEDSSISFFDNIEWWKLNENSEKYYNLNENIDLIKVKPNLKTTQHSLFGHDRASAKHYNEANAIISSGDQIGDVNKDTDEEDEDDEDEELTLAEKLELANSSTTNNTQNNNTNNNKNNNNNNSNAQTVNKQKKSVSSGTLTVVLSQALKANDHSLLETVLNNKDESIIRNTISRLQSSYIIILLSRLAERIARNGNRQLNLTHWIKWVLIFHGGYLLNYPNTSSDLSILSSTLRRKADSLDRMLELKGKLNLLTDKIELKRDMMSWENESSGEDEDEDEVNVEYIEELDDAGLLDSDSDDDEDEDLDEIDDDDADDDEGVYEGEEGMEIDEDAEANYSDVEDESIKTKIVDDIDSDDEYETKLLKKIKNLKNKKSKN